MFLEFLDRMIFAGSCLSATDKLGREFMILLQSAPMTVHSAEATISFPLSLSSLDTPMSFQSPSNFPQRLS